MKIKDIALSAAYVGQRVVKAICVGAHEIWSAVKYIVFADPVVAQICVANFSSDGVGVTEEDAAKVTDLGTVFKGNTEITSFDELEKLTNVKTLNNTFNGCTNLQSVKVENIEIIQGNAFRDTALEGSLHFKELKRIGGSGSNFLNTSITSIVFDKLEYFYSNIFDPQFKGCNKLTHVVFPTTLLNLGTPDNNNDGAAFDGTPLSNVNLEHFQYIGPHFKGCKNLRIHLNLPEVTKLKQSFSNSVVLSVYAPKLKTLAGACFQNCAEMRGDISFPLLEGGLNKNVFGGSGIDRILDLGKITTIESILYQEALGRMPNVTFIHLPETITEIGERAMGGNINLKEVIIDAITPPSIGTNVFASAHADLTIYVPDGSVDAYKSASNWSAYAGRIKPLSLYVEP